MRTTPEQRAKFEDQIRSVIPRWLKEAYALDIAPDLLADLTDAEESIAHWRTKAKCYGNIVHGCTPALERAGFPVDARGSDGAVGGISRSVSEMASKIASLEAENARLREALRKISTFTSCHGPDCYWCKGGGPHPSSSEATIAEKAMLENK